jgi:hypothetical protein
LILQPLDFPSQSRYIVPMDLKLLDPRITEKLLEGTEDTITPLAQARERFYKSQACPYCGGNSFRKYGDPRMLFRPDDPLPRYQLRCENCGCLFDPHSGLVVKTGNVAKALVPSVPLINKDG